MNKKITLHPVKSDGTLDLDTNLYPKTNNIVDDEGESIEVATVGDIQELDEVKLDKVGPLPHFTVNPNDEVLDFISGNNNVINQPIIIEAAQYGRFIGFIFKTSNVDCTFAFQSVGSNRRFSGQSVNMTNITFTDLFGSTTYENDFVLEKGPLPILGEVDYNGSVYDFFESKNAWNKPVLFWTIGDCYFGKIRYMNLNRFSFEFENIGTKSRYISIGFTERIDAFKFSQMLSSTYRKNFEEEDNKVTEITSESTDTQYPSAKCTYDALKLKANKEGPLPKISFQYNDNVVDFLTTNNCNNTPIILADSSNEDLANNFIANINYLSNGWLLFEIESIGITNTRYVGAIMSQATTKKFEDIMTSTFRRIYEEQRNKVTSLSPSSTDTEYPSAKAVWDVKGTKLYKHEVVGKDSNGNALWTLIIHDYIQTPFNKLDFAHYTYNEDKRLYAGKFLSISYMRQAGIIDNYVEIHFNAGFGIDIGCSTSSSYYTLHTYNNLDTVTDTVTEL